MSTIPSREWVHTALRSLDGAGIALAFIDEGQGRTRVLTASQNINAAQAEVAALDILRQTHANISADACGKCPPCQQRLARIGAAMTALTSGEKPPRAADTH